MTQPPAGSPEHADASAEHAAAPGDAWAPEAAPVERAFDVDQAAQGFERAEAELQRLLADGRLGSPKKSVVVPEASDDLSSDEDARPLSAAPPSPLGRCTRACRALRSMARSAERLCDLTGEADARCQDTRRRVRNATRLVQRQCSPCPSAAAID